VLFGDVFHLFEHVVAYTSVEILYNAKWEIKGQ
jgi:hypothetical protein